MAVKVAVTVNGHMASVEGLTYEQLDPAFKLCVGELKDLKPVQDAGTALVLAAIAALKEELMSVAQDQLDKAKAIQAGTVKIGDSLTGMTASLKNIGDDLARAKEQITGGVTAVEATAVTASLDETQTKVDTLATALDSFAKALATTSDIIEDPAAQPTTGDAPTTEEPTK